MGLTSTQERLALKAQSAYARSETDLPGWLAAVADMRAAGISPSESAPYVGVSTRVLYNALKIHDYVAAAGATKADVQKLGITRLVVLAHRTRPEDFRHWRKEALPLSRKQLEWRIKGRTQPVASMAFVLSEKDRTMVVGCLKALGAHVITEEGGRVVMLNKDQALVRMAREWRKYRPLAA